MDQRPTLAQGDNNETAPTPVLDYASAGTKIWSIGTLHYTLGKLSLLFFWLLLGDFALYLRDRSIGPVSQLFLKNHGASDTVIAFLLISLPPFLGMIIGPIVAYRSDRLRSRWGRRIPYLIYPTPFAALAMVGIAFSSELGNLLFSVMNGRITTENSTLFVFGFFWTIFGVAANISQSVFNGLINDVVPVAVLGRFFALFRAVSLLDAILFSFVLIKYAESHYFEMYLGVALIFTVGFGLMSLMVKEGEYPPVEEAKLIDNKSLAWLNAIIIYLVDCFSQSYYLLCYIALGVSQIVFVGFSAFLLLYAKQLEINLEYYGYIGGTCAIVSLFLTYPVGILTDRFHPLKMAIYVMAAHCVVTGVGSFLIQGKYTFTIAMIAQTLLWSAFLTSTASLTLRLFPRSKFTQYSSASAIVTGLMTVGFSPLLGLLLDISHHKYSLIFVVSSILSGFSVLIFLVLQYRFNQYGGIKHYVAPGDTMAETSADPVIHSHN